MRGEGRGGEGAGAGLCAAQEVPETRVQGAAAPQSCTRKSG